MPIFAPSSASGSHALAGAIRGAQGAVQKAVGAEASQLPGWPYVWQHLLL
jgi:hypothetical protein